MQTVCDLSLIHIQMWIRDSYKYITLSLVIKLTFVLYVILNFRHTKICLHESIASQNVLYARYNTIHARFHQRQFTSFITDRLLTNVKVCNGRFTWVVYVKTFHSGIARDRFPSSYWISFRIIQKLEVNFCIVNFRPTCALYPYHTTV